MAIQPIEADFGSAANFEAEPCFLDGHLVVANFFNQNQLDQEADSLAENLANQGFMDSGSQVIIGAHKAATMPAAEVIKSRASIKAMAASVMNFGGVEVIPIYPEGYKTYDNSQPRGAIFPSSFVTLGGIKPEEIEHSRRAKLRYGDLLGLTLDNPDLSDSMESPFADEQFARTRIILFGSPGKNHFTRKDLAPKPSASKSSPLTLVR